MLGERISFRPAPNKAVVGSNAFAHEAGIHQHGMLANPLTYEIMTPASVGVPANSMVLGKHSGRTPWGIALRSWVTRSMPRSSMRSTIALWNSRIAKRPSTTRTWSHWQRR